MSTAFGYTSTSNRPFARPFGNEAYSSAIVKKQPLVRTKPNYDLGLGKNKPVYGEAQSMTDDVTKFLLEHESVRPYPSPLLQEKKRPIPKVQLERKSEDTLHIQSRGHTIVPHISTTSDAQLDVNTVWVEMMIYSEKMKLVKV
jgi:hypothetical protein